jgi:hypothetical protein
MYVEINNEENLKRRRGRKSSVRSARVTEDKKRIRKRKAA